MVEGLRRMIEVWKLRRGMGRAVARRERASAERRNTVEFIALLKYVEDEVEKRHGAKGPITLGLFGRPKATHGKLSAILLWYYYWHCFSSYLTTYCLSFVIEQSRWRHNVRSSRFLISQW